MQYNKQPLLDKQPQEQWIQMSHLPSPTRPKDSKKPTTSNQYQKLPKQQCAEGHAPPTLQSETVKPGEIRMNGQVFKEVKPQSPGPKRPKGLPKMVVACSACSAAQSIPGISDSFECTECGSPNKCEPMHKIFTCNKCQAKVLYRVGTSLMIRCTRCRQINHVQPTFEKELEIQENISESEDRTVPNPYPSLGGKTQRSEDELISQF